METERFRFNRFTNQAILSFWKFRIVKVFLEHWTWLVPEISKSAFEICKYLQIEICFYLQNLYLQIFADLFQGYENQNLLQILLLKMQICNSRCRRNIYRIYKYLLILKSLIGACQFTTLSSKKVYSRRIVVESVNEKIGKRCFSFSNSDFAVETPFQAAQTHL